MPHSTSSTSSSLPEETRGHCSLGSHSHAGMSTRTRTHPGGAHSIRSDALSGSRAVHVNPQT
eukprot:5176980-Prymnesium_polylepis.1